MKTKLSKPHHLHIISAKQWGGGESYVYNLIKCGLKHGDSFTLVTDKRFPEVTDRFSELLIPIQLDLRLFNLFRNIDFLAHLIHERHITSVNYHSGKVALTAVEAAAKANVPCIFFRHNIGNGKSDFYHRFIYSRLAMVICVSDTVKHSLQMGLPQPFYSKLRTLLSGVEIPDSYTKEKKSDGHIRIGYAGRLVPNKGIEVLLRTFQELSISNVELRIAGDISSSYTHDLQNRFVDSRIHFLGELSDMADFYRGIDILVVPSIVPEAFGLTICEGMAYGLPVVATTSGAQAEIIKNGTDGFLVAPNSIEELKDKISRLCNDSQLRHHLGQNAREKVLRHFSMENFYKNLEQLYQTLPPLQLK